MPELQLMGCAPEPLMSYLKALGVLRLVSERPDRDATGCWRNDQFVLRSKLDEQAIVEFFLNEYRPTPIIGPWAGGSGFFGNDNRKAVNAILNSKTSRATDYKRVIKQAMDILEEERILEKPSEQAKKELLRRFRREMPDQFVQWMDAVMALQWDRQAFAPVLGTGGNDGRLDFTQNFMQRLVEIKLFDAKPTPKSKVLLEQSLFGQPTSGLGKAAVGQFSPGRAGGPNLTQGMEGKPTDNPWDFVLMLEGTLMLAGSVGRRMGAHSTDKAVFPFTVRARPVGEGSPTEDELSASHGELWLPLWASHAGRNELEALFAEGRAELSGRPARDSLDFARAVAGLGVDRGITSFARYGFLKRSGKAYLATAMDRFQVPTRPQEATGLLQQLDAWLARYRRACSAKGTPNRFGAALRMIEAPIFDFCRYGRREDLRGVLVALGRAERQLAVTGGQRGGKEMCQPLPGLSTAGLSTQWLKATHDGTVEFDIALALAGIHERENKVQACRVNMEPVTFERRRWAWQQSGPSVVWNSGDLPSNMAAVLARRMLDGGRAGCDGLPLEFRRPLSLEGVAAFLAKHVYDDRIEELLWGLILINHRQKYPEELMHARIHDAPPLPRQYALLKLLFLPRPLVAKTSGNQTRWRLAGLLERVNGKRKLEEGVRIRPEPRVLPLLRAGRVDEACRIAYQRLQASGLKPLPHPMPGRKSRDKEWEDVPAGIHPQRLAAALLLPVNKRAINDIVQMVTRQDLEPNSTTIATEGVVES